MRKVLFRFYGELNDFLPPVRRGRRFAHSLREASSVKDVIEALGVPHPEVDLVLRNGNPVDFACRPQDGDAVSVYPPFRSLDLTGVLRVGFDPPRPIRFVADIHLGKLASFLRLAGFDTLSVAHDEEAAATAERDERVLLTRDRGLLKRGAVRYGYFVRGIVPGPQLAEVYRRFDLAGEARPFTRCLRCNALLAPIAQGQLGDRVPPRSLACFKDFRACPECARVYWRGSHYGRLLQVLARAGSGP